MDLAIFRFPKTLLKIGTRLLDGFLLLRDLEQVGRCEEKPKRWKKRKTWDKVQWDLQDPRRPKMANTPDLWRGVTGSFQSGACQILKVVLVHVHGG